MYLQVLAVVVMPINIAENFIIAVSGSFTVTLDNGRDKQSFLLNHPYQGLLVETDTWRTLDDFSSGAVCLVLAEDSFEENDYIREYTEFLNYKCSKKG